MKPETFPTRQFANCLASVAADHVMQPVLDGIERDLAAWKASLDASIARNPAPRIHGGSLS